MTFFYKNQVYKIVAGTLTAAMFMTSMPFGVVANEVVVEEAYVSQSEEGSDEAYYLEDETAVNDESVIIEETDIVNDESITDDIEELSETNEQTDSEDFVNEDTIVEEAATEDVIVNTLADGEPVPVVTEIPGTISYEADFNNTFNGVTGFASVNNAVNDRGQYLNTEEHRQVKNGSEFAKAISDARDGKVKIIELIDNIDLGYNNFTADEKNAYKSFLTEYKKPSPNASISGMPELNGFTNPEMLASGVTSFKISEINGLTIFSKTGHSIRHAELNVNRNANDIVIRNIHFKDMWQWDDDAKQKAVGWSDLKLNSGSNIWIDHCSFDPAFDGNIDIENGATGISITWCKIGITPEEATKEGNAIYNSIMFMEGLYKEGKLTTGQYKKFRDDGATPEQVMMYSAYHDKCHLCGSGDKDCIDYSESIKDSNGNIRLTLAYNQYLSIGQRLPMIRQGSGHLFNCYINDTLRQDVLKVPAISKNASSNYKMSRCINARNGASIAADTCVFDGVEQPIIGAERQGLDLGNMDARWQVFFKNAMNHSLVVNSKVINSLGTYVGSSWDNEGKNAFTSNFTWDDKSTIGNFAWSNKITNYNGNTKEDLEKKVTPYEFVFEYDPNETLPYEYNKLPLESVEPVVTKNSGVSALEFTEEEWCATSYSVNSVADVMNIINGIGKVDGTPECKAKIDAARNAYETLPEAFRNKVNNLSVLLLAEEEYKAVSHMIVYNISLAPSKKDMPSYEAALRLEYGENVKDEFKDKYRDSATNKGPWVVASNMKSLTFVKPGTKLTAKTDPDFVKPGYTFKGWYYRYFQKVKGVNVVKEKAASSLNEKLVKTILEGPADRPDDLYVKWQENLYSVQYQLVKPDKKAKIVKLKDSNKKVKLKNLSKVGYETTMVTMPDNTFIECDGYKLAGWTTDIRAKKTPTTDVVDAEYVPGEEYIKLAGETAKSKKIVLYAVWEKIETE